jgi:hypothetical protein
MDRRVKEALAMRHIKGSLCAQTYVHSLLGEHLRLSQSTSRTGAPHVNCNLALGMILNQNCKSL